MEQSREHLMPGNMHQWVGLKTDCCSPTFSRVSVLLDMIGSRIRVVGGRRTFFERNARAPGKPRLHQFTARVLCALHCEPFFWINSPHFHALNQRARSPIPMWIQELENHSPRPPIGSTFPESTLFRDCGPKVWARMDTSTMFAQREHGS